MTRRSEARDLIPFDPTLRVVEGEEASVSLADWRERLRNDPEGTVRELVRRFGPARSAAPEVEDLFWRVLVDYGSADDLARAVLGRVRPPDDAPPGEPAALLDLDREHRIRLRGRLRMVATEALRDVVRDEEALERIVRHPSRLPEAAFALRGRPGEAASLYALEHDHLARAALDVDPAERAPGGALAGLEEAGYRRLCRAALRYEVARSLQRVEGRAGIAFDIMESVLRLVDDSLEAPAGEVATDWLQLAWRLSYHSREWLGFRHSDAGRHAEAERAFLKAAGAVPETDLAVAARMFAANAMIRDGRIEEARALLDSLRVDAERLSPPMADEWLDLRARLLKQASAEAEREEDDEGDSDEGES